MRRKRSHRLQSVTFGLLSLLLGSGVLAISSLLLKQSLSSHDGEIGPLFDVIYNHPLQNSNWMKSSIPTIVVSSFGIVTSSVQILSSLVLMLVTERCRPLGVMIWLGTHVLIFIFNVICFSFAVSVKSHEHKKDSSLFWENYHITTEITPNPEGHAYCLLIAVNSIFILIGISLIVPTLNPEKPISLPRNSY